MLQCNKEVPLTLPLLPQTALEFRQLPAQLRNFVGGTGHGGLLPLGAYRRSTKQAQKSVGSAERRHRQGIVGRQFLGPVLGVQIDVQGPSHVLAEELRECIVAKAHQLDQQRYWQQPRCSPALEENLGQRCTGEILSGLGVDYPKLGALLDLRGDFLESDVATIVGVVETPVAILFDDHPTAFAAGSGANASKTHRT